MTDEVQGEKIQKVLARAGFGSRREMESWISDGRVKINGRIAALGDRAGPDDNLIVDGKKVSNTSPDAVVPRVLIYNKPENEICSRKDPEGRPSVYDRLPPISMAAGLQWAGWTLIPADCCYSPPMVSWQTGSCIHQPISIVSMLCVSWVRSLTR